MGVSSGSRRRGLVRTTRRTRRRSSASSSAGCGRIEAGVLEELARRAREDEAAVGVLGILRAAGGPPGAFRVEIVGPDQLVGEGEAVLLEAEGSLEGDLLEVELGAAEEQREEQRGGDSELASSSSRRSASEDTAARRAAPHVG